MRARLGCPLAQALDFELSVTRFVKCRPGGWAYTPLYAGPSGLTSERKRVEDEFNE